MKSILLAIVLVLVATVAYAAQNCPPNCPCLNVPSDAAVVAGATMNYGLIDNTPKACTRASDLPKCCTPAQVYAPAPKACTRVNAPAVQVQEAPVFLGTFMEMPDGSLQSMDRPASRSGFQMSVGGGNGFSMGVGGGSRCPGGRCPR